jgi:hypothetical protein
MANTPLGLGERRFILFDIANIGSDTVEGVVATPEGPLADIQVILSSPLFEAEMKTRKDGAYHFKDIPGGSYLVRLIEQGSDSKVELARETISVGGFLTFNPTLNVGTMKLEFKDENSKEPIRSTPIEIFRRDELFLGPNHSVLVQVASGTTDSLGQITFVRMPYGTFEGQAPGYVISVPTISFFGIGEALPLEGKKMSR